MPEHWERVRLAEVLHPVSRPEPVVLQKTYRILGAHWYAQGLYTKDVKLGSLIQARTMYRVSTGDFVYNRLFAWKGSFAVASEENEDCHVSNEFLCYRAEPRRLDARFLWYYFSRPSVWNDALGLSSGSTPTSRNRLKEEQFLGMEIHLPALAVQNRIVARIEEMVGKIEEARRLAQRAMEEAEALIVSLHLAASKERTVGLEELVSLDERREAVRCGAAYPQVGVKSFGRGLFSRETLTASETTYRWFNQLYEGALVLSQVKGWEGAVAMCGPELAGRYVSPEYRTFRCLPTRAFAPYLRALVPTPWFWKHLGEATRGVGARRERTRPEQFLKLELPFPVFDEQVKLAPVLQCINRVQHEEVRTLTELDALLPSILSKTFNTRGV